MLPTPSPVQPQVSTSQPAVLPQELLRRKRDGGTLSDADLAAFFGGFLAGTVADYQVGAMLMAIYLRGMDAGEMRTLTQLMLRSGEQLSWDFPRALVVDKHSTGGIGDKTSLIILPLAIAAGLKVPMIAGRGLGHTGGTIDKLEAVGWQVGFSPAAARAQVERLGGIIMGQTESMAPLDRRLYALRDVTGTVESVPLIVASILSKKLAEGLGGLVLDVKFGSGAFMPELPRARHLAEQLALVGRECGLAVRCVLSDMGSPLGTFAGNALEIYECIQVLQGQGPADTRELSLVLTAEMVRLAFPERNVSEVRAQLETALSDGTAWRIFRDVAAAQGGDLGLLDAPERMLASPVREPVYAASDRGSRSGGSEGVISKIDVRLLGLAILELGGGRRLVTDAIDPLAGLSGLKRVGAQLAPGEPLAFIHASDQKRAAAAAAMVRAAYTVGEAGQHDGTKASSGGTDAAGVSGAPGAESGRSSPALIEAML